MAEKISTVILKVDLDCRRCYKKISKTVCKLQERENIQTVTFDDKNNTVTISGPFDPKKLIKKLCCKACEVIKDIQIKEKDKTKDDRPKEDKKPKDDKTKEDKPKEGKKPKDDKPKEDEQGEQRSWPGAGCNCGCRPWYYGDYTCPWCGRGYGWVPAGPSLPVYLHGAPCSGYTTCHIICEEEPQPPCSVM